MDSIPNVRKESQLDLLKMGKSSNNDLTSLDSPKNESSNEAAKAPTLMQMALKLVVCAVGIQVSYLVWGLLQEQIMTREYNGERFKSSKFLVFMNRILAFFIAAGASWYQQSTPSPLQKEMKLYKFSYCSISNILSSICQYEALKYVSFPTQVLSKSCKMIPVMLMGYVVSGKRYKIVEYLIAIMVTAGVMVFKLFEKSNAPVKNTEFTGILLLIGYMACDSFTSNWQSALFKEYQVSSMQMMCYVNLFSSIFSLGSVVLSNEVSYVMTFCQTNPEFAMHIMLMSVCSAVGQLFIFYTIKQFGPLVFATIQTVRQLLSIVLSIIVFGHTINSGMLAGIGIVFLALAWQIQYKASQAKAQKAKTN